MLLDAFNVVTPPPRDDSSDRLSKLVNAPADPRVRRIRERMLNMPVDLPDCYDTDLRPEKPWILYEYRFNAAGHVYAPLGAFASERDAVKAGSDFLFHAERFAYAYGAKYLGTDFIHGLTYACYAFANPPDVMGFSFAVERYS